MKKDNNIGKYRIIHFESTTDGKININKDEKEIAIYDNKNSAIDALNKIYQDFLNPNTHVGNGIVIKRYDNAKQYVELKEDMVFVYSDKNARIFYFQIKLIESKNLPLDQLDIFKK
jgi:hypothetical protein